MIFLYLFGVCVVGCIMFLMGQYLGYQLGLGDGIIIGEEIGASGQYLCPMFKKHEVKAPHPMDQSEKLGF